jgi:hypothetical protein
MLQQHEGANPCRRAFAICFQYLETSVKGIPADIPKTVIPDKPGAAGRDPESIPREGNNQPPKNLPAKQSTSKTY